MSASPANARPVAPGAQGSAASSATRTVTLRYFASIREAIGSGQERWVTQAPTLAALRDELIARGGAHAEALARGKAVRLALDQVMASDEAVALPDGAEVAFFPPVTGG